VTHPLLPVSDRRRTRQQAAELLATHRRAVLGITTLHVLAALAALPGPALLGRLVDDLLHGTTAATVDRITLVLLGAVLARAVLAWLAGWAALTFAETVFAELREGFMATVTGLPLSTVEQAGSGDLISRTTQDVDALGQSVRFAVPRLVVGAVGVAVTAVAMALAAPAVSPAALLGLVAIVPSTVWYLRRARDGYLRQNAAHAVLGGTVAETMDGARTVAALRLADRRTACGEADLHRIWRAERYTLRLRSLWFPTLDFGYSIPVVALLAWGGWLVAHGRASVGEVTTVTLYAVALIEPLDEILSWWDELQVGAASFGRITGVGQVPDDRVPGDRQPVDEQVRAEGARYAYRTGHDVLHGVDLELVPGERLAVVGPSGAGKSTLGRLLAGIHPPRAGEVGVGGVPLVELRLDQLRGHVALVTQEHHVFVGTLAENLRLARPEADDAQLARALSAIGAGWADDLPDGLSTVVGSGGHPLTPGQSQQLALARIVLADPHTLVLDEATALLDPRSARHLERSLSAVLTGRTVVAVAHRLHTAHDADRVAVVENGRITELGTHDELVRSGGSYAALWRSWRGGHEPARAPAVRARAGGPPGPASAPS
jgi:ABC-type multidrug transport system fused ATPase/permease subunit